MGLPQFGGTNWGGAYKNNCGIFVRFPEFGVQILGVPTGIIVGSWGLKWGPPFRETTRSRQKLTGG